MPAAHAPQSMEGMVTCSVESAKLRRRPHSARKTHLASSSKPCKPADVVGSSRLCPQLGSFDEKQCLRLQGSRQSKERRIRGADNRVGCKLVSAKVGNTIPAYSAVASG